MQRLDRAARKRLRMGKLNVEQLEDRRMLTITVDTLVDELDGSIVDGDISLRDAIAAAPAGEIINFSVNGTISLDAALGELKIDKNLRINGPGRDQLTIDASTADPTPGIRDGNGIRIFNIDDGQENSAIVVRLQNMTLTGGDVTGAGGAINSVETLHLQNSRITGNSARGAGGGLSSRIQYGVGNLYVTQSTFLNNVAGGSGGGMNARTEFAYADDGPRVEVLNSHFEDNRAARGGGVFFGDIGEVTFSLRNTTLQGNTASVSGGGVELRVGGANGSLTVDQCVISNNRAANGGGVRFYNTGMGGGMYLRDSEITSNTATSDGGGVHAWGYEGGVSISGSEISENVAGARGGGVWATAEYGGVSVSTSTVSGNSASDGGGIAMVSGFALAFLTISNVNVRQNVASETGGGILLLDVFSQQFPQANIPVVDASTIHGNSAGNEGGGIYVRGSSVSYYETIIARSTISANVATTGGGLRLVENGGPITISDSTISGNSALESAGGISATTDEVVDGTINIDRATIAFNIADSDGSGGVDEVGGGLLHDGSATYLTNTLLARNLVGMAPNDLAGSIESDFILIESPGANGVVVGTGNLIGLDPDLGPLADNGGPTRTHILTPLSPAIDAGDPATVAGTGGVPFHDQRGTGYPRIVEGRIDIGAVEFAPPPPLVCDFDQDNRCDVEDLDALIAALAAGINDPTFDLTGNGMLSLADRDQWLVEAGAVNLASGGAYLLGDANLDGVVDGHDFISWNQHKFTATAAWSKGDFNADGQTDGLDFVMWNMFKFQSSDDDEAGSLRSSEMQVAHSWELTR